MVDQRRNRHGDRVWYQAADGSVRTVPRAWTSLAALDPFEVTSGGRACFRPDDLMRLAALLDGVRPPVVDAEGAERTVKCILPHMSWVFCLMGVPPGSDLALITDHFVLFMAIRCSSILTWS